MDNTTNGAPTRAGTMGGTIVCLLLQVQATEVFKTMLLAGTGAAVSYLVSFALQRLLKRRQT